MQNKGYTKATSDACLFTDFMGSTINRIEQIVRTANAKQQRINGEYQELERQLQSTKSSVDRLCSVEKRRRDNAARNAIEHMRGALLDIKDPHFHRMESRYIRKCGRSSYVSDTDDPQTVERKLTEAVGNFDELVVDLNQAFIPPAISNIVGGVVRPYRKKDIKECFDELNKTYENKNYKYIYEYIRQQYNYLSKATVQRKNYIKLKNGLEEFGQELTF